ncbi:permease-like cell division protein FtsX [Actinocrispum wychmicini]|uniref:FtsX extracellular domain-containing protein n=1 Tax=Actinocrispum wychmicini TaxID=1213861 RepID=A0A4R2J1U4_9PSEU|nr:permease-like cell division protein FtsX [Actinocrispum wychmicini]TCO50836.1 hypothetical protein EV192_113217 [Actinocrispum wychmicini]
MSRRLLIFSLLGVVVAAAVVTVVLVTWRSESVAVEPPCVEVDVGFTSDAKMRQGTDDLKKNPQVGEAVGETRAQGYERYRTKYAGDPSMLSMFDPDTYPANVRVTPAPGVDREQLKVELRRSFPSASIQDPCNTPTIRPAH